MWQVFRQVYNQVLSILPVNVWLLLFSLRLALWRSTFSISYVLLKTYNIHRFCAAFKWNAAVSFVFITTLYINKVKRILGWSEHVRPFADESKCWYQVCCSYWKPGEGPIFLNMKHIKKPFKFEISNVIEFAMK